MNIKGKAWKYGNDIDTDVIIPARYLNTSDPEELTRHCLEDLDSNFVDKMSKGDLIVAGENFGCGSSREHAPLAIKAAGVSAVIASSFARIFYRNALNIGLPILECPEAVENISQGDEVQVEIAAGLITNLSKNQEYQAVAFPDFMQKLIQAGGLINYLREQAGEGNVSL